MDNDDRLVGRVLTRREVLALMGAAGAAGIALVAGACDDDDEAPAATQPPSATAAASESGGSASATATEAASTATSTSGETAVPSCVVVPELTEGPYFVDELLERSDIRIEPSDGSVAEGVPVTITVNVAQIADACTALEGAMVDLWQCDALGVYSDVNDTAEGFNTVGQKFLRGFQRTDAAGQATFVTIYPGWYQGRTVHIHFKIRTETAGGQAFEFTSQFFFDDELTDEVHALSPYSAKGVRTLRNDGDGIYQQSGGQLTLALEPDGDGYAATFDIGLQMA
jgi:protocatechuate 3,4-dioxygenase beta subunit